MTSNAPNAEAAESAIRRIGQEFRRLRGLRGERIEDIATYLEVKVTYLFGIEQGDLSVIPSKGEAKTILRRYASYLGLDGEGIIAPMGPIIASLEGENAPPAPVKRGRFDRVSAMMLTASVLLGVLVGWSWIGDVDQFDLLTPPVTADDLFTEPADLEITAADLDVDAGGELADPDGTAAEVSTADLSDEAAKAADALLDELKTALTEDPVTAAGDAETAIDDLDQTDVAAIGGQATGGDGGLDGKVEDPANVLAALVAERGDGAHIYESENTDARVIVRALTNVSVQVTSESRDYVWTRTMKPREMLLVPNRDDLELWTGNAGGIELLLDGIVLPPLGPDGTVLSGLSLSATALETATGALAESPAKPTF